MNYYQLFNPESRRHFMFSSAKSVTMVRLRGRHLIPDVVKVDGLIVFKG